MVKLPQLPALREIDDFDTAKETIEVLTRYIKDLVAELETILNG